MNPQEGVLLAAWGTIAIRVVPVGVDNQDRIQGAKKSQVPTPCGRIDVTQTPLPT